MEILHRLGAGLHANTWPAESLLGKPRYVAIKIFTLHYNERQINSEILSSVNSLADDHLQPHGIREGLQHVVKILDQFTVLGPMNEHVCHVMELVGPSLYIRDAPYV